MADDLPAEIDGASADASDHVNEARLRARQVLSGESHIGAVDDWRRMLVSARDALILIWLIWVALSGFGPPQADFVGEMLVALSVALALLIGISTGRSTYTQVQYYAAELDRERAEIRDDPEHEREEVVALYAAKGFHGQLLDQVVDTLVADDDRLLKVMMEEELGLTMYHVNHPLAVGAWNFGAALVAGLALSVPVALSSPDFARVWMPGGGTACLAIVSIVAARSTSRSVIEFFAVGMLMAVVTGGVVYWLSLWLAGLST